MRKDRWSQRRFAAWWLVRFQMAGLTRVKDLTVRFLQTVRDELTAPLTHDSTRREAPPETRRAGATINRYFRWLHAALESVKTTQRQLFDGWTWESEK